MDILALLDIKGIDYIDTGADEIAIVCPNAVNHQGATDNTPSFRINVKKYVGHCFACNLAMRMEGMTKWLMGDDLDEFQTAALSIKGKLRRMEEADAEDSFVFDAEDEFTLVPPSTPFREDYRGISANTYELLDARKCSVGRYADRIFFKIWQHNRLLGIDARALKEGMVPKYLRNKGCNAKEWLWPQDYWRPKKPKFVCIAEGAFHAVRGIENDIPIFCFYGSNNFSLINTLDLINMNLDYVVYFGDNDAAGIKARNDICPQLVDWMPVYYVPEELLPEGKDAGDLTKEEMEYCLSQRVRFR